MPRNMVISDHHFYHHRIIELCERPFHTCRHNPCTDDCVRDMNEFMVERWNSAVETSDTVYHVGDFGFGDHANLRYLLGRLHGARKILLKGNHDPSMTKCREMGWDEVYNQLKYRTASDRKVLLQHHPWKDDVPPLGVEVIVHGHIHNRANVRGHININVSVEALDYSPIDLDDLVDSHLRVMGW